MSCQTMLRYQPFPSLKRGIHPVPWIPLRVQGLVFDSLQDGRVSKQRLFQSNRPWHPAVKLAEQDGCHPCRRNRRPCTGWRLPIFEPCRRLLIVQPVIQEMCLFRPVLAWNTRINCDSYNVFDIIFHRFLHQRTYKISSYTYCCQ